METRWYIRKWMWLKELYYTIFKERYFIVKRIGDEAGHTQSEWYMHPLVNSIKNTGFKWELKPYYHWSWFSGILLVKRFNHTEKLPNIDYYLITVGDYFFIEDITKPSPNAA